MEELIWCWVIVAALSVVGETVTQRLYLIWALPASLASALFALCSLEWYWQVVVFCLVLLLGLFGGRRLVDHIINRNKINDINDLIGVNCVVSERIDSLAGCGLVEAKGGVWAARGVGEEDEFEVGERLSVVAIEGVRLICKKK